MDRGENNNKNRKAEQNSPENEEESETEYYMPSREYKKEKSITNKTFIQKKRYFIENVEKKEHCLKKESDKFSERKKHIKSKKEISEDVKKDLENKIRKLEYQLESQKEEYTTFKQILLNQFEQQKNQLEQKSIEFQLKLKEVNRDNNRLLQKIDDLQNQVNDLNQFHFQIKLRKLIKNLIEYLFSEYYPHFMHLNIFTKKIEFIRAPIIQKEEKEKSKEKEKVKEKFALKNAEEIINALNRLLDLLFTNAKMRDYIVYFVEPNAEKNILNRRLIGVFNNSNEFFEYFEIDEKDKNILVEIIPSRYFMVIDNFKFDKNIKELINIYENSLFPNKK